MNKDEYLFYWREKGTEWETVFYYKNGKLHREAGPAIASFSDIEDYHHVDADLYKESKEPISNPITNDFRIETLPNGERKIIEEPATVYIDSEYYLNDVQFSSKQEIDAFILNEKLQEELALKNTQDKKSKI